MIIYISRYHVVYEKQVYSISIGGEIPKIRVVSNKIKLRDRSIVTFLIVNGKL